MATQRYKVIEDSPADTSAPWNLTIECSEASLAGIVRFIEKCCDVTLEIEPASESTWQTRLIQERDDLHERWRRLTSFIASSGFTHLSLLNQTDLVCQRNTMRTYLDILDRRIARLSDPGPHSKV